MKPNKPYIKLEDCKKGYLYKIDSRNLSFGVYDGHGGFIGIREKFRNRFLDAEYHYDMGAPYGTVFPEKEIVKIPDEIEPCELIEQKANTPLFRYLNAQT